MPLIPEDQHTRCLHVSTCGPSEPDRENAAIGIYAHEVVYTAPLFSCIIILLSLSLNYHNLKKLEKTSSS